MRAGDKIKAATAPGADGIPPEVLREAVMVIPQVLLNCYNRLLALQEFPACWKRARLILIWKAGKPEDQASSYRPICLLDTPSKLYEALIKERVEHEVDIHGGISEFQFGFRKGRSTTQALEKVIQVARNNNTKWSALITVDVKNAFNTARWSGVIQELENRNVPNYLINVIINYFRGRKVTVGKNDMEVYAGVPQGSILGPTLWNIYYDGVLRIHMPEGVKTIGFADDLAVIVEANDVPTLNHRADWALELIQEWMESRKLILAPEKTEVVVLRGRRDREGVRFRMGDTIIRPTKYTKYLGVVIDAQGTFGKHVEYIVKKAQERMGSLSRLMPNIGGPPSRKREVLYSTIQSILLYAAPVWCGVIKIKKYANMLQRAQRTGLLRIASAYRTVSNKALQVIAGILPIHILIEERKYIFEDEEEDLEVKRRAGRERSMRIWQEEWDNCTEVGQWTKRLIPEIRTWVSCPHREINYFLTQFLTGHGSFRTYTKRIGKDQEDSCIYCGAQDMVEHTVIECQRWVRLRQDAEVELGRPVQVDGMIAEMIADKRKWKVLNAMIGKIMSSKEQEERIERDRRREV